MALGPRLDLRPSQALVMTPQLQQAIRLLALSNAELEAAIAEELANNPLLELAAADGEQDEPERPAPQPAAEGDGEGEEAPEPSGADELLAALAGEQDQPLDLDWREAALETDSHSDLAGSGLSAGSGGDGEEDRGFDFDQLAASGESLGEHLLGQLHGADEPLHSLAIAIVRELDETGYLTTPLAELVTITGAPRPLLEQALALVQSLEPPGIAARSLAECLALQARAADRYDPAMARLIDNLDLLARGQMAALKRICAVDEEDLSDMIAELRGYDPKPGCRFAGEAPAVVVPDLFVHRSATGWVIELNGATLPRLIVNRRYQQQLRLGSTDRASKAWLSECAASAGWMVRALDQRARTIVKVATEIVRQQEGFFRDGVGAMRPLTLRCVAEAIEMHESTVSRATSNKHLSCERGLFELKYFFGSGVGGGQDGGGDAAAAEAVKAAIARRIAAETEILSDDTLVDLLKADGFDLARRTVAKYREAIGIGSSIQRRRQRAIGGRAA